MFINIFKSIEYTQKQYNKFKNFNRPKRLDCFFDSHKGSDIELNKWQCCERILHLILFLWILDLCYIFCNWLGEILTDTLFDKQYMYSIFLIPLFIYIKDFNDIFDSLFTKAICNEKFITVKKGFLYKHYDKLYIKNLNNIELYRSFFGKIFGYCQLDLYAIGGFVSIPFVKDTPHNAQLIKKLMKQTEKNQ